MGASHSQGYTSLVAGGEQAGEEGVSIARFPRELRGRCMTKSEVHSPLQQRALAHAHQCPRAPMLAAELLTTVKEEEGGGGRGGEETKKKGEEGLRKEEGRKG